MPPRWLEYVDIHTIPPAVRNPKRHAVAGVQRSMTTLGYIEPIVLDERTGRIISGHGRQESLIGLQAAGGDPPEGVIVEDGAWKVPLVRGWASSDDNAAATALVAINRFVEAGGWDTRELTEMLAELDQPLPEIAGFTAADLDLMIAALNATPGHQDIPDAETHPKMPARADVVSRRGDIWQLGDHRIMCGDARDAGDVAALVDGAVVALAVTSPPYADRRKYDDESEFEPIHPDAYVEWFAPVAANVAAHLAEDGSWLVNIRAGAEGLDVELYVLELVLAHVRRWGWHWASEFCWERVGIPKGVGQRLKNQFEPIYQFTRNRWKFRPDNVRYASENAVVPLGPGSGNGNWGHAQGAGGDYLGFNGRTTGKRRRMPAHGGAPDFQGTGADVGDAKGLGWAYPGNRLPTFSGSHDATGHTAAFPVGLPAFFIRLFTDPADVVYEPFGGSGSTILAGEETGRPVVAMEISPRYVDLACGRFHAVTGKRAVRVGDGVEGYVYPA